jgi:hypothetical protein
MIRDEVAIVQNKRQSKFYEWKDPYWSTFMVALMQRLEPRRVNAGEIIYHDSEEVHEFLFV